MACIITINSRHIETPSIMAEQYLSDKLVENTKADIIDDILRTYEENKYDKADNSYDSQCSWCLA